MPRAFNKLYSEVGEGSQKIPKRAEGEPLMVSSVVMLVRRITAAKRFRLQCRAVRVCVRQGLPVEGGYP